METSSPLAAMRPAPTAFGREFGSRLGPSPLRGSKPGFQRPSSEYFNIKNVHGSSPSASLAADLSQNFKLNETSSPRFPTPRRALFTTAAMIDAFNNRDYVTTPPLPSSSPGHVDMMDVSPLPHKGAFVTQIEIESPTKGMDMTDDVMMESPIPRSVSVDPSKAIATDLAVGRRKMGMRRPSLTRAKGYTHSGSMATRSSGSGDDSQLGSSPSSSMSLSECFEDSPPKERRPLSANSPCSAMVAPRHKVHFNSINGVGGVRNGSPIVSHTRRTSNSNPFMRPKKQYRRSLSMFDHSGDMAKPKKEEVSSYSTALQSVMDIEEPHEPILPHFFPEDQNDSIPRITRSTMLEVLDGKYSDHYAHKMIIDCRFEYEYEGGHIDGAINYNDKELLASHLFDTPIEGRTLLIFHCEYSAHRAPIMARYIRAEDRNLNAEFYPRLTYPEIYILDGGYSSFFNEHRERCYPQAYVEMNDAEHVNTCEREMGRLRNNRRGLGRAQTFAFGDHGLAMQDSPTAAGRANSRLCDHDVLGASPLLGTDRAHARRMVSF